MNPANCYRLLGLRDGASIAEVKASYRRLARQYHPDVNSEDLLAHEKFIALTEAYKFLLSIIQPSGSSKTSPPPQTVTAASTSKVAGVPPSPPPVTKVTRTRTVQSNPPLSATEKQLKWAAYGQLQQLLRDRRFARVIALVEGLAQRIPQDPEVRQWQAIAYASWGRHLVNERQLDKARIYLKKALRADPHNRSLWAEVERDFRRIERIL